MAYRIGQFTVLGEHEDGDGVRLLPHTHGNAYPWWSESTRNVLEALTEADVKGKRVLDYGAGASAILGLCAASLGAHVDYAETDGELMAIAERQIKANGHAANRDTGKRYDFVLANLGDAEAVGKVSKRAPHGLGTDKDGAVIRW